MQANVMIVEDVKEMAELIAVYLGKEGVATKIAESGELALQIVQSWKPDVLLLDLNLTGMDGFEFLSEFRKAHSCPVIIVSARTSDEDIITGLGYGADEFVTKPFSPRVLVARVRALLRRNQRGPQAASVWRLGPLELDPEAEILKKNGERIPLSVKEFNLLKFLIEHAGKPQSPDEIYKAVWNQSYGDLTTVAVYIQRLRKKLEDDPASPRFIETVHSRGYRFRAEATRDEQV